MFQMLAEVVGTEEFLALVALSKLVHVIEMLRSCIPIGRVWELFTAVAAHIGYRWVEC